MVAANESKKAKVPKVKKPKVVPSHPKVSEMVNAAISTLKERGGSSVQAIKKYINATYKVDAEKLSPFIKKYLKTSVVNGGLVQTKGKGASGSFRIGSASASGKEKKTAPKKAAVKKAVKPKKEKVSTPKKVTTKKAATPKPKKSPVKKAKPAAKKVAKPKTVSAKAKKPKATPKKAAAKKGKK
ncbi:histone H1 [Caerostris extrusa]|uniref:Histone H1 n=1 Tax=Caerostris extrusa TaxID=172846 RepID=A0AAV4TPI0_CAEEX|nr:histone H1 [Caerostris extrusa]